MRRKILTERSTIGELSVNGVWECYVLEDRLRAPGVKVWGQTAISAGRYPVIINHSQRFGQLMPLLLKVPNFQGIRIHPGNTPANTSGCLLVGRTLGTDAIGESRAAYEQLFDKLKRARLRKEAIEIEIVNPAGWDAQFATGAKTTTTTQTATAQVSLAPAAQPAVSLTPVLPAGVQPNQPALVEPPPRPPSAGTQMQSRKWLDWATWLAPLLAARRWLGLLRNVRLVSWVSSFFGGWIIWLQQLDWHLIVITVQSCVIVALLCTILIYREKHK